MPLPTCRLGAPPAAAHSAPQVGGIRVGAPPEVKRRLGQGARPAPGAAQAEERIRAALGKAQQKLIAAQRRLQASANAVRAKVAARG